MDIMMNSKLEISFQTFFSSLTSDSHQGSFCSFAGLLKGLRRESCCNLNLMCIHVYYYAWAYLYSANEFFFADVCPKSLIIMKFHFHASFWPYERSHHQQPVKVDGKKRKSQNRLYHVGHSPSTIDFCSIIIDTHTLSHTQNFFHFKPICFALFYCFQGILALFTLIDLLHSNSLCGTYSLCQARLVCR